MLPESGRRAWVRSLPHHGSASPGRSSPCRTRPERDQLTQAATSSPQTDQFRTEYQYWRGITHRRLRWLRPQLSGAHVCPVTAACAVTSSPSHRHAAARHPLSPRQSPPPVSHRRPARPARSTVTAPPTAFCTAWYDSSSVRSAGCGRVTGRHRAGCSHRSPITDHRSPSTGLGVVNSASL